MLELLVFVLAAAAVCHVLTVGVRAFTAGWREKDVEFLRAGPQDALVTRRLASRHMRVVDRMLDMSEVQIRGEILEQSSRELAGPGHPSGIPVSSARISGGAVHLELVDRRRVVLSVSDPSAAKAFVSAAAHEGARVAGVRPFPDASGAEFRIGAPDGHGVKEPVTLVSVLPAPTADRHD